MFMIIQWYGILEELLIVFLKVRNFVSWMLSWEERVMKYIVNVMNDYAL